MLDMFYIAIEEGIEKGKTLGSMGAAREMVLATLNERFNSVSARLSRQIRKIQNQDILKGLQHQAVICKNLYKFEFVLRQVI